MIERVLKHFFLILTVFVFLLIAGTENVLACSCMAPPTVVETFPKTNNIITATLDKIETVEPRVNGQSYARSTAIFKVNKVYKGNLLSEMSIKVHNGGGGDCTSGYSVEQIGKRYLLYFGDISPDNGIAPDVYVVSLCGRSRLVENAKSDISYLDNRSKFQGRTRISGSIWAFGENVTVPSTANLKITVTGLKFRKETLTLEDGRYEIWDVPPGKYDVSFEVPQGWKARGTRVVPSGLQFFEHADKTKVPIVVVAKKHVELATYLRIDSSIAGRVFSPAGKPLKNVCVSAYWLTPTSDSYSIPRAETNENGEFEIDMLPPGKYRIELNCQGKVTSENPFHKFYYPSTSDPHLAEQIEVDAGRSVRNLKIRVSNILPMIKVNGIVQTRDGIPVRDADVRFTPDDDESYDDAKTRTNARGQFSLEFPKGASGQLQAETNIFQTQFDGCPSLVSLRASREGTGPESTVPFTINKDSVSAIVQLKIPVDCRSVK